MAVDLPAALCRSSQAAVSLGVRTKASLTFTEAVVWLTPMTLNPSGAVSVPPSSWWERGGKGLVSHTANGLSA